MPVKNLQTISRKSPFKYDGSLANGITLYFGTGRKETVSQQQCQLLINEFNGKLVNVGRSFKNPPPNSLGEWILKNNVSKRAIASYLAPVLVDEGYANWVGSKEIQFRSFSG